MRFPTLEEAIACNEAVREPTEVSPSADDDEPERVEQALRRAQEHGDPIEAAASLLHEVTTAQGFYEGNKRTAVLLTRWFIAMNTNTDPDVLIRPADTELGDLLVAAARGAGSFEAIVDLF
ncbi:MAG TPA: Fic family protein, partial [Acidimicrobiales bacterium]